LLDNITAAARVRRATINEVVVVSEEARQASFSL
jgi:hypothetical protein